MSKIFAVANQKGGVGLVGAVIAMQLIGRKKEQAARA